MTASTKATLAVLVVPTVAIVAYTLYDQQTSDVAARPTTGAPVSPAATAPVSPPAAAPAASPSPPAVAPTPGRRTVTVALSQWPGHLALVVGNGGLTTQPGSAAAAEGLDLKIVFIEDAPSKNKALVEGQGRRGLGDRRRAADHPSAASRPRTSTARAFIQIDWSRGGDACVATQGGAEGRGRARTQVGGADVLARSHGARVHARRTRA